MNIPKIRTQIFLDADDLNLIAKFGENNHKKTISEAINLILKEWKRYKVIVLKAHEKDELERVDEIKNAEVVKL